MAVDPDPRDEFLALILGGCTPREAADVMGKSMNYFRRLRNPMSSKYDKEFADDYDDLMHVVRDEEINRIRRAALARMKGTGEL